MIENPRGETPAIPRGAVKVYKIGWSLWQAKLLALGIIAVFPAWCAVFAYFWGATEDKLLIIGGLGMLVMVPATLAGCGLSRLGENRVSRKPIFQLSAQGVSLPGAALITWAAVRRFFVTDGTSSDLMLELRAPPGKTLAGLERFKLLFAGHIQSQYLLTMSGANRESLSTLDIVERLESFRKNYSPVRDLDPKVENVAPREVIVPPEEMIVPRPPSERWLFGIVAPIVAAIMCAIPAWGIYEAIRNPDGIPDAIWVFGVLYFIAAPFIFRKCLEVSWNAMRGKPLLIVNRTGLTLLNYGHIPWSVVRRLSVEDFGDDETSCMVLCVYVSELFYRLDLRLPWHEALLLRIRNRYNAPESAFRLRAFGAFNVYSLDREYSIDGAAMLPLSVDDLMRVILRFKPPLQT